MQEVFRWEGRASCDDDVSSCRLLVQWGASGDNGARKETSPPSRIDTRGAGLIMVPLQQKENDSLVLVQETPTNNRFFCYHCVIEAAYRRLRNGASLLTWLVSAHSWAQ